MILYKHLKPDSCEPVCNVGYANLRWKKCKTGGVLLSACNDRILIRP